MRTWTFELQITRCVPDVVEEHLAARDADEADAMVRARADACLVLATQRDGERYGDDFYVWLAGDRALLRRDEHREWYATDPAWIASAGSGEAWFADSDGPFPVQAAETVSRAQALEALGYWLRTGGLLPSLTWE